MRTDNNIANLVGEISSVFEFSHETHGEKFYAFDLKVERLSGNFDLLPILISERLVNVKQSAVGAMVQIDGQLRSYNFKIGDRNRTILSIFVNDIQNVDEDEFANNFVALQGFICKKPIYRKTPKGKDIADVILAVNRPLGRTDYIPCILWGRDAIYSGTFEVGQEISIEGRFQSREYQKRLENGETDIRTAFELSVNRMEVVNNECED